jgi:hypothetical protein
MPTEQTLKERVREVMACGDFADVEDAVLALAQSEREAVRKQDAAAVCYQCELGKPAYQQGENLVFLHYAEPQGTGFTVCAAGAIHELAHAEKATKEDKRG